MSTIATPTTAEHSFEFIREFVHKRSAIVLEPAKNYLIESRLNPVTREHGLRSLDELVTRLRGAVDSALHKQVIEAMTTNETSFFRDLYPFECLKTTLLPELIAKRAATKTLNFWCGAASTGQEPYTVCMLIREQFPVLKDWNVRFTASDLSEQVLERARSGLYNQCEVNRGMPAALLIKYFTKVGLQWQLKNEIREMVKFFPLNLKENWPPMSTMDIVFLRNVLIYFSTDTKKEILGKIRRMMTPDGALFLGGAETTLNLDDAYHRVQVGQSVYYQLR